MKQANLRLPIVLAALTSALTLTVAGCGVKKETHAKALSQIKTLEGQLAESEQANADKTRRIGILEGDLTETAADRDKTAQTKDAELAKVRGEKEATTAELVELRRQRDAAESRIAAYRKLQERFQKMVATGALQVGYRNGQMVLKLPSGVLFPSGSADLSEGGMVALNEVLKVLNEFKDRRFSIAGHTDTLPIKGRKFKNNWYLSTSRALSVVEFMVDAGFPAKNLAAAGYGEFDPVAPNDTEKNRELNRRIEIILVPNLEELPSLTGE
jgi:chemotaxis protein MotB